MAAPDPRHCRGGSTTGDFRETHRGSLYAHVSVCSDTCDIHVRGTHTHLDREMCVFSKKGQWSVKGGWWDSGLGG